MERGAHGGKPAFRRTTGDAWIFHQEGLSRGTWHFGPSLPHGAGAAVHFSSVDAARDPVAASWPSECLEKVWQPSGTKPAPSGLWVDKDFPPSAKSIGNLSCKAEWVPVRQLREGNWQLFDHSNHLREPRHLPTRNQRGGLSSMRNPCLGLRQRLGRFPQLPVRWFPALATGGSSSSSAGGQETASLLLRRPGRFEQEEDQLTLRQNLDLLVRLGGLAPSVHDARLQRLAREVLSGRHDLSLSALVDATKALHELGLRQELGPLVSMATESADFLSGDVYKMYQDPSCCRFSELFHTADWEESISTEGEEQEVLNIC
eukprot:g886.t1